MDNPTACAAASAALADIFTDILLEGGCSFEAFEERAVARGHEAMARAMGLALERYDEALCSELPARRRPHDARTRTLATEVGDVTFSWHRLRDASGATVVPLADALDLPWGCRVSPGAEAFLVEAGAEVSYAAAARLLARKGGSRVSAATVMRAMRRAGERCAADDERAARDLFDLGVKPGGETVAGTVCLEADGTWVRLQGTGDGGPRRAEVKAMVAYSGKAARGRKVVREHAVRHGCVAAPSEFWPQAVAAMGSEFDLSKVERVHLGTDGEGWCKGGAAYLPLRVEVAGHLDRFHVRQALLSCFDEPAMGWQLVDVVNDGGKEEAAALLEACIDLGVAREGTAGRVLGYLRNNMGLIAVDGPSLGTMESENQHLYKSRMASVPCAWSRRGASDMARVRSRVRSRRAVPARTRAGSATPLRRRRDAARELAALSGGPTAGSVPSRVGRGYEPPAASVAGMSAEVRYAAAVDSGMAGTGW